AGLRDRFGLVERGPVVWPNVPPAFVYRARSPRPAAGGTRRADAAEGARLDAGKWGAPPARP
ncbi:hypothetical protein ABZ443_41895, partial [Streptomyces shenzhenensis]